MKSFLTQLKIEIQLYFRQPFYLLFSIAMPLFSFYFFGSMFQNQDYGGPDFFSMYIPGFCMLILFSSSVFNIGNQLVSDKEKGVYKRIMATPISLVRFIGIILMKGFLLASVGFMLIMAMAKYYFKIDIGLDKLPFCIVYFLFIIFSLFLGVGIAILSKRLNTYSIIMMVLFFPMFLLSDASIPLVAFPKFAQKIAEINPLYHANKILRYFWSEEMRLFYHGKIWLSFMVLGGIFLVLYVVVFMNRRKLYEGV